MYHVTAFSINQIQQLEDSKIRDHYCHLSTSDFTFSEKRGMHPFETRGTHISRIKIDFYNKESEVLGFRA